MKNTRVICLGSGDAFSAEGRFQSAYIVESPEGTLLLDCGATILTSTKSLKRSLAPVDMIFISHLHGDHIGGLPYLFLQYLYIEPRSRPLIIAGPPEVESRVRKLFEAMYPDTAAEPFPFELQFIEAQPGCQVITKDIRVEPFVVSHSPHPVSYGCLITAGDKKIVYSGDSGWMESFITHTQDADLFLCECTYFDSRSETHIDYPRIVENLHRFGAKKIVLTHLGQEVLAHREEVSVEMVYDGMIIDL
jgi:ribonuclease BN (tRNA processing enzyme)